MRRDPSRDILVASLLLAALHAATPTAARAWNDWNEFYRAFTTWSLDSTRVASVQSLMIERDAGTIVLEEGRLALAAPLGGRTVAATFEGRGRFSFVPPSEVERQQLRRFYGSTTLQRPFRRLTLIFSDSTLRELTSTLSFHEQPIGELSKGWSATFPFLTWRKLHVVRPLPVTQMLLDGKDTGLFWACIADEKSADPVFFALVPEENERVHLYRRHEADDLGFRKLYRSEVISQFFARGDPDTLRYDVRAPYRARHHTVDVTIAENLDLTGTARVELEAVDSTRWMGFDLASELVIATVTRDGRPQAFFQEPDNDQVWVKLDPPAPAGAQAVLEFRYGGKCFDRRGDWISHRFPTSWTPQPIWGSQGTWMLTFHHPSHLQLVAAGVPVGSERKGTVQTSRWRIDAPSEVGASFDINFLRGVRVAADSLPPVTVWTGRTSGAGRVREARLAELRDAKDTESRTARDVASAVQFFTRQLGRPLTSELNAVETPLLTYLAYPGLIHMMRPDESFQRGPALTYEVVRAHEVAHQWFGLGVRPATYHDRWLSEGFANFCGVWYHQAGRQDPRHYLNALSDWRGMVLQNRKFLLGAGQQAGPIWLGPRTNSSATPDDYDLIVYAKGAWVLHMLRNMMLDEGDPEENRFRGMMRDFYTRFAGSNAFTEDFRHAVERAMDADMGWFFDQWVYGTDVPTYRVSWKTEPVSGGQWKVTGRIQQSDVPARFKMPVLVRVELGKERYARQRIWVEGPVTEVELPLVPAKPTRIVFNDLESVLCEVIE